MSHNPQSDPGDAFALPGHRVLAISGPAATGFAQAQFMNDVAGLPDHGWQWNGWLTPKGRLVALFALLRIDAQTLWVLTLDSDPAALATELRRFVFRSKVAIEVRDDLHASGWFGVSATAAGATIGMRGGDVEIDLGTLARPRTLRIGDMAGREAASCGAEWARYDLEHGLPRIPPGASGSWTPQQLSLERLRAYSVKKGCYPGQEIVARTHFLGQAKRGLALLAGNPAMAAGDEVTGGGRGLGTLACSVDGLALAVLTLDRDPGDALEVAGAPARERALLDGLAR